MTNTLHKMVDGVEIPLTLEEIAEFEKIETEWATRQVELAKTQYQRDRADKYPSINDYVDGIVKGDQAQVQAYIDACLAVKAKYPKP
jgi:hypothetical protein